MFARIRFYHVLCVAMACAAIGAGVAGDMNMPHIAKALKLLTVLSFASLCILLLRNSYGADY